MKQRATTTRTTAPTPTKYGKVIAAIENKQKNCEEMAEIICALDGKGEKTINKIKDEPPTKTKKKKEAREEEKNRKTNYRRETR